MSFQKFYTKFGMLLATSTVFTATAFAQNPNLTTTPTVLCESIFTLSVFFVNQLIE